jgi:stage II sporulation protein D
MLVLLSLAAAAVPPGLTAPEFRIALFSHQRIRALTLQSVHGCVSVCGDKTDGPCWVLAPGKTMACSAGRTVRCRLDGVARNFALLVVDSDNPLALVVTVDGTNDPPRSLLLRNAQITSIGSQLQIITRVGLESYVTGVLAGEASVLRSSGARQAMAILARTWALRWRGRHGKQGFDFCTLTHCQVFRPQPAREQTSAEALDPAVIATHGQTLEYQGALADPYFSAHCGGITEAAVNVWPDRGQPYLISIHDPYCLSSSQASWKKGLTPHDLQLVLRESFHLPITSPLSELMIEKRDSSGRALILRVVDGATWEIDANQFRYAIDRQLGWQQIKSNLYSIKRQGDSWLFSGRGLGHGVGLCQAGAERMGRMGSSPPQIISTYFPGTRIALQSAREPGAIASSEHFDLAYPASLEPWVKLALDILENWRHELGAHAEILLPRVRVITWTNVGEFIAATGQPGWVSGSTDGQSIALQPLDLLARKNALRQTLRHELTHLVVHRLRAKGVPFWFEEGWVLYLTGERIEAQAGTLFTPAQLEAAVTRPRSVGEMKLAYWQALERARRLARKEGEPTMWRLLTEPEAKDLRW